MEDALTFPLDPADFLPDKKTKNNDLVRSKSEVFIANLLKHMGLRYEYEKPIRLRGKKYVPDFYLPDHDLYIEYYGILHWKTYEERTARKIEVYAEHKVRCIHLFSSMMINLNRIIRYELNRIDALRKGEPYRFKAELPVFIRSLEENPTLGKKGSIRWTPVMDQILRTNRRSEVNLAILAGILRRDVEVLRARLKTLARKSKRESRKVLRDWEETEAIGERIRKAYGQG